MNKNTHRLVFNKSRGCVVAVSETARSCGKCASGASSPPKRRRKSSNCSRTLRNTQFQASKVPSAQQIRAQAAPVLIVKFTVTTDQSLSTGGGANYFKGQSSQSSTNSSSSGSVGISYGVFTNSVSVNASASKGQGKSEGQDTSYSNTSLTAGNTATIKSGGDTNVKGTVVTANQIKADIGTSGQGSLTIESLQDKSTYSSSQSSSGFSISVPVTVGGSAGGSASANKSKENWGKLGSDSN